MVAVVLALALTAVPVLAATFIVNSLDDPGSDGVCDASECTLREAVGEANASFGEADVIEFAPGLSGTIPLTSGQLSIIDDVQINGPGADQLSVSGEDSSRVFGIASTAVAGISGLTVTDGSALGAFDLGGGILNAGTLTLTDATVTGNEANEGGGIYNFGGTLTVEHSTISDNTANEFGGGIANVGTLTVEKSTISGNTADFGGGIFSNTNLSGLKTTITNSTISGNTARFGGGTSTSMV